MKNRTFPIVPEGFLFCIPPAMIALASAFFGWCIVAVIFTLLALFVLWFFRNPRRRIPANSKGLVSPADGRVLKIEDGENHEHLPAKYKKISIFMNVFNVHVNRAPCAGTVKKINYHEGKFLSANLDKASAENERSALTITTADGQDILVIQVAGLVARRIVCWTEEGMQLEKGERFGLIRFGSRLEVFVPPDTVIFVSPGDKVTAGETVLGQLS